MPRERNFATPRCGYTVAIVGERGLKSLSPFSGERDLEGEGKFTPNNIWRKIPLRLPYSNHTSLKLRQTLFFAYDAAPIFPSHLIPHLVFHYKV